MDTQSASIDRGRRGGRVIAEGGVSVARAAAVFVLVAAGATAVLAETRPRYGRTLTASLLDQPVAFDPQAASTHAELTVADLLFDGLYRVEGGGQVVPELAAAMPQVSEDGLEVEIRIRVGAFFHDGSALEAADVASSLTRLRAGGTGWLLAAFESVAVGDAGDVVKIVLRYPEPDLALHLASPVAAITRGGKTPSATSAVGTGPFTLRSIDRKKQEITFDAFDRHHRGRPYLDRLRLRWHEKADEEARAYEVGELQISFRGDVAFSGHKPKYETSSLEGGAAILSYVGFGRAHADVLADAEFRSAVSLALRRKGMENLGNGEKLEASVRPDSRVTGAPRPTSSETSAQLRRAKAALAVAAARVTALADLGRLQLEILVNRTRLDDIDIADKVLAALDQIGVRSTVVEVSPDVFEKRVSRGACDLYIGQLLAPVSSQRAEIAAAFAAGGDDWVRKALDRAPLDITSALSEFRRRLPIIPLFHRAVRAHYRTDVFGLEFNRSAQIEWAELFMFGSPKVN